VTTPRSASPRPSWASTFEWNSGQEGGAIAFEGTDLTIADTTFRENSALYRGGAVFLDNDTGSVVFGCDGVFEENTSGVDGGAVFLFDTGGVSSLTFTDSTFDGNSAIDGGAINVRTEGWGLELVDSTFVGNVASDQGGALFVGTRPDEPITLTACSVTSNTALGGGAVYLSETEDAVLTSLDSDWGEGAEDNTPADVNGYSYGAGASFTCNASGCE
jgi:predicted outer membrane repeat protein